MYLKINQVSCGTDLRFGRKTIGVSSSILLSCPAASFDEGGSRVERRQGRTSACVQVPSSVTCLYLSAVTLARSYSSVSSTNLEIKSPSAVSFKL